MPTQKRKVLPSEYREVLISEVDPAVQVYYNDQDEGITPVTIVDARGRILEYADGTRFPAKSKHVYLKNGPTIVLVHGDPVGCYSDIPLEVVTLYKDGEGYGKDINRPRPINQLPSEYLIQLNEQPVPHDWPNMYGAWDVSRVRAPEVLFRFTLENRMAANALAAELIRKECNFTVTVEDKSDPAESGSKRGWTFEVDASVVQIIKSTCRDILEVSCVS